MAIKSIDLNDTASEKANPFVSITKDKNQEDNSINSDSRSTHKSTNYLCTYRDSEITKFDKTEEESDSPTVYSDKSIEILNKIVLKDNVLIQKDKELMIKKRLLSSNIPLLLRSNLKRKIVPLSFGLNPKLLRIIFSYFHAIVV